MKVYGGRKFMAPLFLNFATKYKFSNLHTILIIPGGSSRQNVCTRILSEHQKIPCLFRESNQIPQSFKS